MRPHRPKIDSRISAMRHARYAGFEPKLQGPQIKWTGTGNEGQTAVRLNGEILSRLFHKSRVGSQVDIKTRSTEYRAQKGNVIILIP